MNQNTSANKTVYSFNINNLNCVPHATDNLNMDINIYNVNSRDASV